MADFVQVWGEVQRALESEATDDDKLQLVTEILYREVSHYDWVGYYLASPAEGRLYLGPYTGEPTEHTDIEYGEGVCGQAAEIEDTFLVGDVTSEPNYLSCSPDVESEIVVPIFSEGELVGELDIDSYQVDPFTYKDKDFLERVADLTAELI